ncbi:hypothetical protein HZS_7610 [Henneguya salminicola]|nr:hypothetical protein HZS_7610 [Henneguya salminicola]
MIKIWPILIGCENLMNKFELEHIYIQKRMRCLKIMGKNRNELYLTNDELLFIKTAKMIEKDVERCDKNIPYFKNINNLNKLHHILLVHANEHIEMGYIQGMSDLLAPILLIMQSGIISFDH